MALPWSREALDLLPRLGWVQEPTPVEAQESLASALGLAWLGVKRDDLCAPGFGSTKIRKLDFLLAAEPWRGAAGWVSMGAVGSGHLVALSRAAAELGRRVEAHLFWEPLSDGVMNNLAQVAEGPCALHFHSSRAAMALREPGLLLGSRLHGMPVIPPGASNGPGTLGAVRAGLELAEQVRGGLLPEPDFVYVSYGTGGTAAGLALGLPLGGLRPEIRAVAAVERWWTTRRRLAALDAAARALLDTEKLRDSRTVTACPLLIVRDQLGAAYGVATPASDGATRRLRDLGVPIEPLYSGKAMAALLAAAPAMRGRRVLFWQTARGPLPASSAEWDQRLPSPLRARLWRLGALPAPVPAGFPAVGPTRLALSRRALLLGLASAALAGLAQRLRGYALPEGQPPGLLLAPWELCVLSAAAEALLPESPGPLAASGPDAWTVAANVDRYLVGAPPTMRREIRALLALTEHGAGLAGRGRRMSRMGAVDRREWLLALRSRGTVMAQAVRGLRDLCLLGYWQDPRTWVEIGYGGPLLPPPGAGIPRRADGLPLRAGRTDSLCAAPGALPRSRVP